MPDNLVTHYERVTHYKLDEFNFDPLQKSVQGFEIEYMIAFNKEGKGIVLIRKPNDAQDANGEINRVWKEFTEELDQKRNEERTSSGLPESKFTYFRIERTQQQDKLSHIICATECDLGGDVCGDDVEVIMNRK